MAGTSRSQSTDPFQINRFHIIDTEGFLNLATPAAGFNTGTTPEMNIGTVEYQEGINAFRRKYPGETTFQPVVLTKGMVKNDSSFYKWVRAISENRPYRTTIIMRHYHRDDVNGLIAYQSAVPYREYHLLNAFSNRVKMGSDFDALSGEISIEELEIEYEYFRLFVDGQEIQAATLSS